MAFPPTDWLDWTTAEYDVGAPATSLSFERWFRNPVGLAQGAAGAPRVQGRALGNVVLPEISYSGTTPVGIIGLDRVGYILAFGEIKQGSNQPLRVRYSNDNGASYEAWQNIRSYAGSTTEYAVAQFSINLQTGTFWAAKNFNDLSNSRASGTHTVPSDCNAFQISGGGTGPVGKFNLMILGGVE